MLTNKLNSTPKNKTLIETTTVKSTGNVSPHSSPVKGQIHTGLTLFLATLVVVGLLSALLYFSSRRETSKNSELMVYVAAGMKPPFKAALDRYQKEFPVAFRPIYSGSGKLLSQIRASKRGDIYIAADSTYTDEARRLGLVDEVIPLASIRPVIAVARGNPKGIRTVDDLVRSDVKLALANANVASVGRVSKKFLTKAGKWDAISAAVKVEKPTVTDVANDVKIGTVDAAIIWDVTANQYPEIETIESPIFKDAEQHVTLGILRTCTDPAGALRFGRYLGAPEKGLQEFKRFNYGTVDGDPWEERPKILLFSGGVNRLAIKETIREFEAREGVDIIPVYNGCGILVSAMKSGEIPDAYFACDTSFVNDVQDHFHAGVTISTTDMVIIVQKGNPRGIQSLKDLGKKGLKVGVANAKQSALGELTQRLLKRKGLQDAVNSNVVVQTPTADLLVNQIRAGPATLDAAVVYRANTPKAAKALDIIDINEPDAQALQPFVQSKESRFPRLVSRLRAAFTSALSRERFEKNGFSWLVEGK